MNDSIGDGTVSPQQPNRAVSREESAYAAYTAHSGAEWTGFGDGLLPDEPDTISDLRRFHMEITYGASWARDSLDLRTRSLLTLAVLMTLGDQEEQLTRHFLRAERSGVTREEVIELLFHMTGYIGVPRAAKALTIARGAWRSEGDG